MMNPKDKAVLEVIKKYIKDLGVTNRKKLDDSMNTTWVLKIAIAK